MAKKIGRRSLGLLSAGKNTVLESAHQLVGLFGQTEGQDLVVCQQESKVKE